MIRNTQCIATTSIWIFTFLLAASALCLGQTTTVSSPDDINPLHADLSGWKHYEIGALIQGGQGLTQDRDGFKFFMAGVHVGKILTGNVGPGPLHGNFENAIEFFPFWQSYTPKFQRRFCTNPPGTPEQCSALYTVGGTYTGLTTTTILRWNFVGTRSYSFWAQGGGGTLWTNHKYPAFGGPPYNSQNDGPNADTSIWNFTPQFGVGVHHFLNPRRSVDFSANAVHISSASLGDRNPGVNASVQFSLGYTWWK